MRGLGNGFEQDLAAFTIRLANKDQVTQHWKAEYVPWPRGHTWEEWKKNEGKGLRARLGPSGVFQAWALVRRDDYEGKIYSACETFRRPGFKKRPGEEVEKVVMYGVAGVVTPVDLRQHGYATHLCRLLHYCLADPAHLPPCPAQWGAAPVISSTDRALIPHAQASVLYSDIGSTCYERATIGLDRPGWVVKSVDNHEVVWNCHVPAAEAKEKQWDWIYAPDLLNDGELLETLRQAALAKLHAAAVSCAGSAYTYDPTAPWLLSHFVYRSLDKQPDNFVYPRDREPVGVRIKGKSAARAGDTDTSYETKEAIAVFTWSLDMIGDKMDLAYHANLSPEQVPELLEAIDMLAHAAGRSTAWAFGRKDEDVVLRVVGGMEDRLISTGRRAEMHGDLIGVAWYGREGEECELLDRDMLAWM